MDLKFTVKLDKTHTLDLDKDLGIDRTGINDVLGEQPALFAWYATLHELAKNKSNRLKSEMEVFRAVLDLTIRKRGGDIKLTEASISALIVSDPDYIEKDNIYTEAKKDEGMLMVAKQAFEQRKDMLVSIASNMRSEIDSELKINKEAVKIKLDKIRAAK